MPDVTYKIIIEGGANGSKKDGDTSSTNNSNDGTASDTGWLGDVYKQYKTVRAFAPVASAVSIGKSLFQWQASLVGRNTGSQLTQQKINVAMNMAGQALSTAGLMIGAIATANPLLAVASITSGFNTVLGYIKEQEQYNYERRWENIGLTYARERAGASFNRSRTQ